jgi:tRNA(His) guanylyltransferase
MSDSLGDRMKSFYEDRSQHMLMRRAYTVIRVDGKAFHTYTRGLKRPFDEELMQDMDITAAHLCKNIMGAKLAFVQSDEISVVITDFDDLTTQGWFDMNLQKMCSVSASMATSAFNRARLLRPPTPRWAEFDSRAFQLPNLTEVENYLIWRQQDATRNSISAGAQALYSHKQLHNVSSADKQELMHQKGVNWNDYPSACKRGRCVVRVSYEKDTDNGPVIRSEWRSVDTPIFTQDRSFIRNLVPDRDKPELVEA